jgi:hypothetical protein
MYRPAPPQPRQHRSERLAGLDGVFGDLDHLPLNVSIVLHTSLSPFGVDVVLYVFF